MYEYLIGSYKTIHESYCKITSFTIKKKCYPRDVLGGSNVPTIIERLHFCLSAILLECCPQTGLPTNRTSVAIFFVSVNDSFRSNFPRSMILMIYRKDRRNINLQKVNKNVLSACSNLSNFVYSSERLLSK